MSLTNTIADIAQADIAPPALDVCMTAPAAGPWPVLPDSGEAADAYFARLVDEGRLEEATRFVAAWLGPRRAVWWATLCVWNALRSAPPEDGATSAAAIDAAVAWVVDPTESNRRAAQAAAELVGFATPAGAAATAAFWSEGSISLPGQPEVPPPLGVAAKAAANAVLMAAAAPAAAQRDATLRQSLRIAAEILAGANLWTEGATR
jgi:hypothetical protein